MTNNFLTDITKDWLDDNLADLENLFTPPGSIYLDMSDVVNAGSDPVRVEMRKLFQPATGKVSWEEMIAGPEVLIGMVGRDALPKEGEEFYIYYHTLNGIPSYNLAKTDGPVKDLAIIDSCYYFTTEEGAWRVKLEEGN